MYQQVHTLTYATYDIYRTGTEIADIQTQKSRSVFPIPKPDYQFVQNKQ